MGCPFCNLTKLQPRTFYRDSNWVAFLAAPPHTRGHTILAAVAGNNFCPQNPNKEVLAGISSSLPNIITALKVHYKPKDVLFASLRGSEGHFHIHLFPLWEQEESAWRRSKPDQDFYKKGHLLEFLGFLEERGDRRAAAERQAEMWTECEQRELIIQKDQFKSDLAALRRITRYGGA